MVGKRAAFVASGYRHFQAFHLPYVKLLQRNGYEVHAFAREDEARPVLEQQGVICHDVPIQRNPFRWDNWRTLRMVVAEFRACEFEMVHVHTPVAGIIGRLAAQWAGVGTVLYTAHGFHFYKGAPLVNWLVFYPLERMMARMTDHLMTINGEDLRRAQTFPVRGQVHFVPGVGVDTKRFRLQDEQEVRQQIRAELGISPEEFVILCIAELNPNKNQMQVIQAVQELREKERPIRCLFVGQGEAEETLRQQVSRRGLEERIHFLGYRSDVPELLAASDVCTLVSFREGLPRSLMEAMAAGKPIVATDIRGNRDLVQHEASGLLVPVGDAAETARAFDRLYLSPELRAHMKAENLKSSEKLDISNILAEMERIYFTSHVRSANPTYHFEVSDP